MLIVKIKDNVSLDKALKELKKKVRKTKQNNILQDRKAYKKKSVRKREQKQAAIRKQQKGNNTNSNS